MHEEHLRGKPESTSEIISEVIKPGAKVVVVGPSFSLTHDATLLLASSIVNQEGEIFVADPESASQTSKRTYDDLLKLSGGAATWGIGDVDNYLSEIQKFQSFGFDLKTPRWLGPESTAANIPLENDYLDILIDHMTSPQLGGRTEDKRVRVFSLIYGEYNRVLKKDGKILLFTSSAFFGEINKTIQIAMEKTGLVVETKDIEDIVEFPMTSEVYSHLQKFQKHSPTKTANNTLRDILLKRSFRRDDRYFVKFKPEYPATKVIIGTKI